MPLAETLERLGLAGRIRMGQNGDVIRWGSLSTARIARNAVVPAAELVDNSRFTAVASRDLEKAKAFADELGLAKAYGSYEELLDDPDIDAVYNALPNSMHFEWTVKAAEAGKHILCEKPIADDEAQAREMAAACKRNGVLLVEAFMYRFNPRLARVQELLAEGSIGDPMLLFASFAFNLRGSGNWRLGTGLAGGALADVGCYCLNVSRTLFDGEPHGVYARLEIDPELGVDMSGVAMLDFSDHRRAVIEFSFETGRRQRVEVVGSTGSLVIPKCFLPPTGEPMTIEINTASDSSVEEMPFANSYAHQLESFSNTVLHGDAAVVTPEDSIANTRVIDAIKESSAVGRLVGIQPQAGA